MHLLFFTNIYSYFTPHHIDGVGTFQDGGLTFNNPVSIALEEAAALFPDAPEPSLVTSIGTGSTRGKCHRNTRKWIWWPRKWTESLASSYPIRILQACRKVWDSGNHQWEERVNYQKASDRRDFFRFDVDFQSRPPALDNVDSMDESARITREAALESSSMKQLGQCFRAEMFIFELDPSLPPHFVGGVFECVGHILCKLRAGTVEFEAFMYQLHHDSALFRCQGRKIRTAFRGQDGRDIDGNFRLKVAFYLPSRQHQLKISLEEGTPPSICSISGSPFTLDSLMRKQNIDATFGTKDHRKRVATEDSVVNVRSKRPRHSGANGSRRKVLKLPAENKNLAQRLRIEEAQTIYRPRV